MAGYHIVDQGDHLSSIAKQYGFSDYHTIWNHPNNAQLKQERQNPNVVFPGDRVFIPDRELREESRGTDQRHRFVRHEWPLRLRLVLEDLYEKPIAHAKCILTVDGDNRTVTTTAEGKIDEQIALDAHEAALIIQDPQTPFSETRIEIKIGNLNPVEKISGQEARLDNLGYFAGHAGKPDDLAFRSAVEEFQCDHGLQVDGVCGPKTQARLKTVHGC